MKSILRMLLTLTLFLFTFSCNDTNQIANKNENIETYLKSAGVEHNKGLDFLYNTIKASISKTKTAEDIISITKVGTDDFLKKHAATFITEKYKVIIEESLANIDLAAQEALSSESKSNLQARTLWSLEDEDKLTANQKRYLSLLKDAVNNEELNLEQTLSVFEDVRTRSKSDCSEEELFVIISAIEIGTNSLTYWHDNYSKWQELFKQASEKGNSRIAKEEPFSWKSVGISDIEGGVGGAVGVGVYAIAAGPPGWVAGGATVAGAAIGTSAGNAVGQLLRSWWD